MANNNHFLLTLDTLAPSGSITAKRYYNVNGDVTIVKGDATHMYVWFDDKAAGERADAPASYIEATDKITSAFAADGNYYYHLVLVDDVGNESEVYNTEMITYDVTKPEVTSVSINNGASYTTSRNVTVVVKFEDALSGPVSVQLGGDITAQTAHSLSAEEIAANKVILTAELNALTAEEGEEGANRTVTATVTDAAGNTSVSVAGEDSIHLDTVAPTGALYLKTADGSANLPAYVNKVEFMAQLDIDNIHEDVVGYKIWGDVDGATTEPISYTTVAAGTDPIEVVLNLTADPGVKTIFAKIIDVSGNETELASKTTQLVPPTAPAVITSDKAFISKIEGFNSAIISVEYTEGSAPTKSWKLLSGETIVKEGEGAVPATIEVTTNDAPFTAEGAHELVLEITDVATNVVVSDPITVTSDFTGPVPSTITVEAWYKTTSGFVASATDAGAGMAFMQAWVSNKANDEDAKGEEISYAITSAADTAKFDWSGATESAENYVHIKYTDAVGNVSYAHSPAFGYDTVAPGAGSISIPKYTNSPSVVATIGYDSSDVSGVAQMKVWGDIESAKTENEAEWITLSTSYAVTLTAGDGNKTVYVKFKDVAGNESVEPYASGEGELDQTVPAATLVLRTADDSAVMPEYSSVPEFAVHISGGDDAAEGTAVQYLLYGDFTYDTQNAQGITEASAEWKDLVYVEGQAYMLVSNLVATSAEEEYKYVYLKVKDNAGNESAAAVQTFFWDPSEPEVVVSGVDYNRISKMHTARSDNAAKYNDETNFVFTPSEPIQAYKVVAYADQAAAEAGSAADAAIPQIGHDDHQSSNMEATGINRSEPVAAKIVGADLESAVPGDGIKIIVVYVQNLAGKWSVAAQFTV